MTTHHPQPHDAQREAAMSLLLASSLKHGCVGGYFAGRHRARGWLVTPFDEGGVEHALLLLCMQVLMAGKSRDRERRVSPSGEPSNTLAHKWHSQEMSLRKR